MSLVALFSSQVFADDVGDEFPVGNKKLYPMVHGRIYIDGQTYDHSSIPLGTTVDMGTARLSLGGKIRPFWRYLIQYDFANRSLKDAWVRYDGLGAPRIKLGAFQEPFSLEEKTSSRFITFIQRGLPNALVPGYHVGLEAERRSKLWTGAVGIFGEPAGSSITKSGGNASIGVTGRLTWSPVNRERAALHLGLAGTFRVPNNQHTLRIRETPESALTSVRYINTNHIQGVDHFASGDLEGAFVAGSWSAQAEYIQTDVTRRNEVLRFRGAYGYISWFPTGESRNYQEGRFRRVHPLHKAGAVEIALRYSFLNLNSGSVTGGKEEDATLGINWYFNSHMRVMLNLIKARAHLSTGTERPNIVLARFQTDF
ncbi:MAG TPA: porin [Gammaproteobacteria bacterium]|nr:porin [Gammaproteobacteria bacterium]